MKKSILLRILGVCLVVSTVGHATDPVENRAGTTITQFPHKGVSLVSVIADPFRFDGKEVIVTGFVSTKEDFSVISFNKESLQYNIALNSVYLDVTELSDNAKFKKLPAGTCCVVYGIIHAIHDREGVEAFNACKLSVSKYYIFNEGNSMNKPTRDDKTSK